MSKTVRFGTLLVNMSDSVPFDIFLKAEFRTSFLNILINKKPPTVGRLTSSKPDIQTWENPVFGYSQKLTIESPSILQAMRIRPFCKLNLMDLHAIALGLPQFTLTLFDGTQTTFCPLALTPSGFEVFLHLHPSK